MYLIGPDGPSFLEILVSDPISDIYPMTLHHRPSSKGNFNTGNHQLIITDWLENQSSIM